MTHSRSWMARSARHAGALFAVLATLSCTEPVGIEDAMSVSFSVAPEEVAPGGALVATLTIRNRTRSPVTLTSGMGCVSYLSVDEAPRGDPVKGTGFACLAVLATYPFAPEETRTWTWDLAAETEDGKPLDPGVYHLKASLNVLPGDRRVAFRVR